LVAFSVQIEHIDLVSIPLSELGTS
jgi:hypothetical protein